MTEVVSVRVKKSLKREAEKLGIDMRAVVEKTLEEIVAEKKTQAQKTAKELRELMDVKPEDKARDVNTS
jgi:antitoxin component of RelBE/YafQ-DinJ toxin-antitoxin module